MEVMISLSSLHLQKAREIQLKPVQTIHETQSNDSHDKETTESAILELSTELQQLTEDKQRLMKETQKAIDEEKEAWETEKQIYIESAKKEGYEAGFEIGKTESTQIYEALIEKANVIVHQTETDYHKEMEHNSESIVQLAVHIAEKIIQDTLKKQPEAFMNIVKPVLRELKETGRVTIYLHPDNYEYVFQQKEELTGILEETKKISIYADESLPTHSCIIEHPYGQIDASIDTQLEQIRNTLLEIASESTNGNK